MRSHLARFNDYAVTKGLQITLIKKFSHRGCSFSLLNPHQPSVRAAAPLLEQVYGSAGVPIAGKHILQLL